MEQGLFRFFNLHPILTICYLNQTYYNFQIATPAEREEDQILQDLLRQKLYGSSEISPLPARELMDGFLAELTVLNDEVTHQREGCHLIIRF